MLGGGLAGRQADRRLPPDPFYWERGWGGVAGVGGGGGQATLRLRPRTSQWPQSLYTGEKARKKFREALFDAALFQRARNLALPPLQRRRQAVASPDGSHARCARGTHLPWSVAVARGAAGVFHVRVVVRMRTTPGG